MFSIPFDGNKTEFITMIIPFLLFSSCSTIYIDDSTVSNPNLKNTIKCVSLGVYYLIKNRKGNENLEIFDEKLHPLSVRSFFLEVVNKIVKSEFYDTKA